MDLMKEVRDKLPEESLIISLRSVKGIEIGKHGLRLMSFFDSREGEKRRSNPKDGNVFHVRHRTRGEQSSAVSLFVFEGGAIREISSHTYGDRLERDRALAKLEETIVLDGLDCFCPAKVVKYQTMIIRMVRDGVMSHDGMINMDKLQEVVDRES